MKKQHQLDHLSKFLLYIIGRHPDEFGLVPDNSEGYLKIKDVLKVCHEEEGYRHIRESHFKELLLSHSNPGFQIKDNLIKPQDTSNLPLLVKSDEPPKILFTTVSNTSYPHVLEKGILPTSHSQVILSQEKEFAKRMGQRKTSDFIVLEVHTAKAIELGIEFFQFGQNLFIASSIPINAFTGPPLSKEKPETSSQSKHATAKPDHAFMPGSFILDPNQFDKTGKKIIKDKRVKDKTSWKHNRKRLRKEKENIVK
ncbi:MAG: RNA 2'-phosphotransferase [Desulfobacterales bacterium]|nr:RNA 2'-phosphotransferase [Desulfobacterales bacterium]